jgi:hypothetical protein
MSSIDPNTVAMWHSHWKDISKQLNAYNSVMQMSFSSFFNLEIEGQSFLQAQARLVHQIRPPFYAT